MHKRKIVLLTSIFTIFFISLFAQPKDNSPYSRYGLGDIHNDNFVFNQGMGNLGATAMDPWHINLVNPASYSYLQATAFEVGMNAGYKNLSSDSDAADVYSGNLDYFALGFPLINPINDALERVKRTYDFGLVFALKPHSTVGYNVLSTEAHPDEGTIERSYIGNGGTYKFMTGFSGRYKDFSLGINAGYLFGKINYQSTVYFVDLPFAYNNDFNESFSLNGFLYNVGATYTLVTNKSKLNPEENTLPNKLVFGVYGNTSTSFNTKGDVFYGGVLTSLNLGTLGRDTLYLQDQLEGKGKLPANIGAGISYQHGKKILLGLNYEHNFWSQYSNEGKLTNDQLLDAFSVSAGIDYVPDHLSYTNAFQRMHYRAGFYYKTDGRSENGVQFSEAALNLGFGIPFVFKRKTSNIDLSLSLGQSIDERLIRESFVKFGIGLTFNDQEWFIKRRYY